MTLISDSRVHKAYRLYRFYLGGGEQKRGWREREREREKNIGSNLLDGEKVSRCYSLTRYSSLQTK